MKHLIALFSAVVLICLASCKTGNFASSGGVEEVAYISVISSDKMANKQVIVQVDDNAPFAVKVQRAKQNKEKHNGKLYGIKPGRRHVKVTYGGNVVYSQDVFLSSQQTKTINL